MCNHIFNKSSKTDVSYCTNCGILSYKGRPSLSIVSLVKNTFQFDPLLLKFKSSQFSIDYCHLQQSLLHRPSSVYRREFLP